MSKYSLFLSAVFLAGISLFTYDSGQAQCSFTNYTLSPSGYICSSTATVTLSGSQSGISYQLTGEGGNVGGAVAGTGSALTWSNVSIVNGTYVVYAIKSGCSNTVVASTGIFSIPPVTDSDVTINATNGGIICPGGSVMLTASVAGASGRSNVSFQWFNYHGGPINGQTSASFTTNIPGIYDVLVSCNCGSVMVQCPGIIAGAVPDAPGPVTGTTTIATGSEGQTVYTVTPSGNATSYAWSLSNPSAGTITSNGTAATVTWNNFIGSVTVNAIATSVCGSTAATGLNVTLLPRIIASNNQNYIMERDVLNGGVTSQADFNTLADTQARAQITYFDGLGRAMQNTAIGASPDGRDIVTPVTYDLFGRQDK